MPKKYLGALVGVLVLAVAGSGLALAKAGKGKNQQFDLTFTTKKPKTGTGLKKLLTFRYNFTPQPQGQEANPVTGLTFKLPKGTKFDFKAIPAKTLAPCTKAKLGSSGDPVAAGCKQIGKGSAVAVVTGLPNPITITEDAVIYAGPKVEILRLRQRPGQLGQTANIFIAVKGSSLVAGVPKFCAADNATTPFCDTEVVLTKIDVKVNKVGSRKHPLLRTPATCPKSKVWKSSANYSYRSTPKEKVVSTTPCTRK